MPYTVPEHLKAFIENYRAWPEGDVEIGRALGELVDEAEACSQEYETLEGLVQQYRLHELHGVNDEKHNATEQTAIALKLLSQIRAAEDEHMLVALFENKDPIKDLKATHKRYDELEVLRSRVLGVVTQAGAIAPGAKIDDNRLVILLQTLMP